MAVEIKTEGDLIARFNPTSSLIDQAYFRAYDSLATVNGIIYILCGVVAIVFAFAVVYASGQLTQEEEVVYDLAGVPMVSLGGLAIVFAVYMFYFSLTSGGVLMTRVVPLFVFLVLSLVVLLVYVSRGVKSDQWQIAPEGLLNSSPVNLMFLGAVFLTLLSSVMCWINSKLRTDRLHFLGTGFLSFIMTVVFMTFAMMYVAAFVLGQVRTNDLDDNLRLPFYIVGGLAAFFGIMLADSIAVQVVNAITGFGKGGDYAAAAPELANATYRSRQMVMSMFFLVVAIPFALVWKFQDGLVENVSTGAASGGYLILATLTVLPMLTLIAAGMMEVRMAFPSTYFMLSNLMIGLVFFVVGTQLIPWNRETMIIFGVLLAGTAVLYMLAGNVGSNLSVVALIGATFMAVKYAGKVVIENLGDSLSDAEKLMLLGVPLLVFTGLWFFRSYYKGDSYSVPFTLMVFSLAYIFNFFDNAVATRRDYILPGNGTLQNIGLDFVLVVSVLMGVTSLGAFSETQIDFIQRQTATEDATATSTITKFAINILIGYGGAYLYNELQSNPRVEEYLRESQENASRVWRQLKINF